MNVTYYLSIKLPYDHEYVVDNKDVDEDYSRSFEELKENNPSLEVEVEPDPQDDLFETTISSSTEGEILNFLIWTKEFDSETMVQLVKSIEMGW